MADLDLREQPVGGVTFDNHAERVGEVRGRAVDDREVGGRRRGRVGGVDDPHGRARDGARLQAEPFVLVRRGGQGRAQAGGLAVRGVLDLRRMLGAVVSVHRGGHHAGRVELRHQGPVGDEVLGRVGAAGAVQDRRYAGRRDPESTVSMKPGLAYVPNLALKIWMQVGLTWLHCGVAALADSVPAALRPPAMVSAAAAASTLLLMDMTQFLS